MIRCPWYVILYKRRDLEDVDKIPNQLTLSESKGKCALVGLAQSGESFLQ